ncbi:MAG: extracellular solute-binding protein [Chloroflexi bacterium]|nr:extracellular solute-binding protein [Chloroflexota bacterium]
MIRKTISRVVLIGLVCSVLVFLACAPPQAPAPSIKEPVQGAAQQGGWEQDWQKTLAEARKEGSLNIYTPAGGDFRAQVGKAFKDKFGVSIEWTAAKAQELPTKLFTERRAGLYLADFMLGSVSSQMMLLKPQGLLDPIKPMLVLPEVLDEKVWFGGRLPWIDNEKMYTVNPILAPSLRVSINTSLVKPDEIKSYNDLLDPKYREKILFENPTVGGKASRTFSEFVIMMGPDFWKKLAANRPVMVEDEALGAQWLAHGKYPILISSRADIIAEYIKAGAPLKKLIPKEGGVVAGGAMAISLINRPPHPNAAGVFANWYLGKEASTILSPLVNMQSARLDVSADHLSPEERRDPSVKYLNTETEDFILRQGPDLTPAMEIFGPLLK